MSFTTCDSCGSTLILCSRKECGRSFPRRTHEDETSWGSRRYCSRECAAAERQLNRFKDRVIAEKPCSRQGCEKMAVQRRNESPNSFMLRKYCSAECSTMDRRHPDSYLAKRREARQRQRDEVRGKLTQDTAHVEQVEQKPPLIKPDWKPTTIVVNEPAQQVWRPAAWRALENRR